jgi:hypothetical protein
MMLMSIALVAFTWSWGTAGSVQPQGVLPDAELYETARRAAAGKDYVNAIASIYAYLQRNTDHLLQDANKREQVWDFYHSAIRHLNDVLHPPAEVRAAMSTPPSLPARSEPPPAPLAPATRVKVSAPPTAPATPAMASAGSAYPIMCRGGGNLHFSYEPYSGVASGPQIWIRFEHGTSSGALAPGQCAWPDRPVAPKEPSVLVFAAPVFGAQQFSISWQHGQVMGISSELTFVNALLRDEGMRTFRVYNNGQGYFIVSAVE